MNDIVLFSFAIVLLVVTLRFAFGYLALPMLLLRTTGAMRIVRWVIRRSWRGLLSLISLIRVLRRRPIRRPGAGPFVRLPR